MQDDIEIKDGYVYGGWREQLNLWTNLKTSIHDDSTAQKVGMRGGTIPGIMHLNLFPPILQNVFGDNWFEKGSISLYYTYATLHKEKVRSVITLPPKDSENVQVEARVEMPDGRIVAKGTVSIGESSEPSYLRGLELKSADPNELRILKGFKTGDQLQTKDRYYKQKVVDDTVKNMVDPLDYYRGKSPWEGSILPPSLMYRMMTITFDMLDGVKVPAVPFYGATEIRSVNGPVKADFPYTISGKLKCVGISKKTEFLWEDTELREKESGKLVATMLHMNRFMKAGSPAYEN